MVESLAPMWEEERQRCGGSLPDPPPDPPRTPQLLSHAVTAVRQEFQVGRRGGGLGVDLVIGPTWGTHGRWSGGGTLLDYNTRQESGLDGWLAVARRLHSAG